jgi:hypothetical protein
MKGMGKMDVKYLKMYKSLQKMVVKMYLDSVHDGNPLSAQEISDILRTYKNIDVVPPAVYSMLLEHFNKSKKLESVKEETESDIEGGMMRRHRSIIGVNNSEPLSQVPIFDPSLATLADNKPLFNPIYELVRDLDGKVKTDDETGSVLYRKVKPKYGEIVIESNGIPGFKEAVEARLAKDRTVSRFKPYVESLLKKLQSYK